MRNRLWLQQIKIGQECWSYFHVQCQLHIMNIGFAKSQQAQKDFTGQVTESVKNRHFFLRQDGEIYSVYCLQCGPTGHMRTNSIKELNSHSLEWCLSNHNVNKFFPPNNSQAIYMKLTLITAVVFSNYEPQKCGFNLTYFQANRSQILQQTSSGTTW